MRRWAVVAVLLVASACTESGPDSAQQLAASAGASSSAAPADDVTRVDIVVEDTSRPTDKQGAQPAKSSRTLPLMILIPPGDGPFPIVVFSHSTNSTGPRFDAFLRPIAREGYLVVAPTYPLSSGDQGLINDYGNQALDAWFAADEVVKLGNNQSDALYGRVDAERIAFAGHSLGAMTTVGAVYNSCCYRPTVDAAIVLSGVEAPFPNGDYTGRPATPLLLAHGDKDTTIVSSGSDDLFAAATGPTAFLRFPTGNHNGTVRSPGGAIVADVMLAWLDQWVRGDGTRLAEVPAAVEASGIATYTTKNL